MIISVVKAKDEEPDASRSETRNKLVRVVIFTLVLHALTGAMDWSFHLEVPDGGVVRDLTFRLQSKFLALSTDPDSAAAWPPNRCEALLAYSVFKAVEVWISLFSLARALATIGSTVAVTIYLNPHYLAVFTAGSRTNFVPFFFIVVCTDVVEFMHRREHLRDLSRREHDARLGSLAVLSKQVEWSRSAAALGSKVDAVEAADLEASKVAVVVLWRRCFHAFMHRVASAKAFSGVMKVATAILTYRAGMMVVEGQIDISQFVALILSLGVLAQARDALRQTMVTCYYNEPSLRAISDVLNMGEDFSDEASSGEDDDESATLV